MRETILATLYHNRRDIIMSCLLAIAGIAIFLPMMSRWQVMGDYTTHNQLALDLLADPAGFFANTPHFLYHLATASLYYFAPLADINAAAAWVMVICHLVTVVIIYRQIRVRVDLPGSWLIIGIVGLLSICLTLIMPINFFTPENLYFGYIAAHVYHNPTMIIMKPLALLLFFNALPLFLNSKPLSRWRILSLALLTALSLVAKPSFVIAFVPALGIVTAFLILRRMTDLPAILRRPIHILRSIIMPDTHETDVPLLFKSSYVNWAVLIGGIVLPSILVLFYQTMTWTSSGGIGIEPFRVLFEWTLHYDDNADQQLLFKFLMSSALPITVYVLHIRHTYRNLMFNTAWVTYGISLIFFYLFVDYTVIAAGDFGWSAQIALLILYVVSVIFLVKHYSGLLTGERLPLIKYLVLACCLAVFILHMIAGLHWYHMHMTQYMEELIYIWW